LNIKDIAQKAGVSLSTVSRVINSSGYVKEETKELVLKAMQDLNYKRTNSSGKASKKSNRIGVIIPDITNPFFSGVLKGVYKVAVREKLNIILCDTNENINKEIGALEMLKEQSIKGLIITPTTDRNEFNRKYLEQMDSMGVPIILLDRDLMYSHFDAVYVDNIKGSYEAVEALIHEGHRKIAVIAGPLTTKPGRDRVSGYEKALLMNNIPADEKYMFYGDFRLESGYNLTKKVMAMKDPPTAIFVCNNMMTMGCLKALKELNVRIPEDIAIIGFDDIDFINLIDLQISVVDRPTAQMGELAMDMLIDRIYNDKSPGNGEGVVKEVILPTNLIKRGSERLIAKDR